MEQSSSSSTTNRKRPRQEEDHRRRPLGVFEFPWKRLVVASPETDGCDLRDVFFCSLVDGSSAKIGLPGDRLGKGPAPFSLFPEDKSWPSDEEIDGLDCIWKAVLRPSVLAATTDTVSKL